MSNNDIHQDSNLEIPGWVVNQIGRISLENEVLRSENAVLRANLQRLLEAQRDSEADES